ncbi:protein archease [Reticulomyxa filosa]|uniref:Protein archease n=1 Tax=Reticulomyxa filosa TaxID=46433 RepID=X6NLP8_RETFI|nr:protein archease [Reticulomyxa filosa]|eukprot:ETO26833.1 protein archease [Reticulomyxa filosa]
MNVTINWKKQKQNYLIEKNNKENLDHTADIQLHSWGDTLLEAFEQVCIAMFGYMYELEDVQLLKHHTVEVSGHDMSSLLFNFLNEFLGLHFEEDYFIFKDVEIILFDPKGFSLKAIGYGEKFDRDKHGTGTEVKAITYSAMQIKEEKTKCEVWVVVDI